MPCVRTRRLLAGGSAAGRQGRHLDKLAEHGARLSPRLVSGTALVEDQVAE